jgi:hypothetical protein
MTSARIPSRNSENQKRPVLISGGAGTPSVKTVESVFDLCVDFLSRIPETQNRESVLYGWLEKPNVP